MDSPVTQRSGPQSVPSNKIDLAFVRDFLSNFVNNVSFGGIPERHHFWSRKDEGSLFLPPETREEYLNVRKKLLRISARDEDLSETAIDLALRTAVFEVVDIPKRRDRALPVRVNKALEKLERFLTSPPGEYKCWIEVGGLDTTSLPTCFGDVRFVVFGADQMQTLKETIQTKHTICRSEKLAFIDGQLAESFLDRPTALVKVGARDAKAALALAKRTVRATIECLNFFSDMISHSHAWLFLPGRRESHSSGACLTVASNGSMGVDVADEGLLESFSIAEVRSIERIRDAVKRAESLLVKKNHNEVEEMILTAVRWGGRATIAKTPEESFLLFAIALECVVLPQQGAELTYRLSQRAARLVGENGDQRLKLFKIAKKLYGIRSKIVHSGHYEVTEEERDEVRAAAKEVIVRLLMNRDVQQCRKSKELDEWFDKQALK